MSKTTENTWQGRSKGTPLGYQIFIWVMQYLGMKAGYFVLIFVAFYYFLFARKEVKASRFYNQHILKLGFWKTHRNVYLQFYKLGQTLLDKVAILAGFSKKFTFEFDGEDKIRALANGNQGAILLSAHVGNWEIAGQLLKRIGVPVHIVMYDNEYENIKQLMDETMKNKHFNAILIKDDFSHLIQIHKAIKRKEIICIHGDRFVERNLKKTAVVDFMGKDARFPLGPFELVSRFKIPCLFVYGLKKTSRHYQFYAFEGPEKPENAGVVLQSYKTALEKIVWKYPTQWFNFYDFWLDN
jgi:predicted LPLAT superfamily acyltransferase